MKTCTKCLEEKLIEQFSQKRGKPMSRCKTCHNAYYKEYYNDPERYGKHKARVLAGRNYGAKYGLTPEQLVDFRARNNGMCELCNIRPGTDVDHDHITMELRGHLCSSCNTSLGKLGDSVAGLTLALAYLTVPPFSA